MGRAKRNPSPHAPALMGFASLYPSYEVRPMTEMAFSGMTMTLPQPQLLIPLRRHLVAPGAVRRRAAAVAGDDAPLLAFDIGIDAGHPGIDFVGQQPDAERFHVIGPGGNTFRRRLQPRQSPVHRKPNKPRHPVDA